MKRSIEPLEDVFAWYEIAKESYDVTRDTLQNTPEVFPESSVLSAISPSEAIDRLKQADNELDDLAILSLFSIFEQLVKDFIMEIGDTPVENCNTDLEKLIAKLSRVVEDDHSLEHWRFKEILNLFESRVREKTLNNVKQIHDYRNGVAHWDKREHNLSVEKTFDRLKQFLKEGNVCPDANQEELRTNND